MPHSPLLNNILSLARLAQWVGDKNLSYEEALALRERRRTFLKTAAVGATAFAFGGVSLPALARRRRRRSPLPPARIAIIGGGLAGLTAAYELRKARIEVTVYEANTQRLGGRCRSNRSAFAPNIIENGGELIDSGHKNVRALARELKLQLDNVQAYTKKRNLSELYHVNNGSYSEAEVFSDYQKIADQLNSDYIAAPFPQAWDKMTDRGRELDQMTLAEYIATYAPGGAKSNFAKLLSIAYTIEFGAETHQQSAYNLVSMLGSDEGGYDPFSWFGESDEAYRVRGGNDQLVTRLAARISKRRIRMGHELVRSMRTDNGVYTLIFRADDKIVQIEADHVVLALPFSILRDRVDFDDAGFDERKLAAINTLPMGNNCKLHMQFNRRVWHDAKCGGDTYADLGFQNTWESTRAQSGKEATLVNFTGGDTALRYAEVKNLTGQAREFLAQWERMIPGSSSEWNGKVLINAWPKYFWSGGSYSYYAPGNYAAFAGYEGVRQGNCHFCGEHTSIEAQGYLEGAVESGKRCAQEVIADRRRRAA